MQAKSTISWGRRAAALVAVSGLSIAATVAVMPLKPVAAQGAPTAAPVVRGLPDFTELVDLVGPFGC